jgi:hypothetical protein
VWCLFGCSCTNRYRSHGNIFVGGLSILAEVEVTSGGPLHYKTTASVSVFLFRLMESKAVDTADQAHSWLPLVAALLVVLLALRLCRPERSIPASHKDMVGIIPYPLVCL